MTRLKTTLFLLLVIIAVVAAACSPAPTLPSVAATPTLAGSATPAPTRRPTTEPVGYTPLPTRDLINDLVTLAYTLVTPAPRRTQTPATVAASPTTTVTGSNRSATSTAPLNTAPSSVIIADVIIAEPILIQNAVNTADCKIRNIGDCTPTMKSGVDLYFTWRFGVETSGVFQWGQAAVVITKDGQPLTWTQVGNGLVRPPGKDVGWKLTAGKTAEFRAGMEDVTPGSYTARLVMCTLSPIECNANQGWQNVGGEAITFVIVP